MNKNGNIPTPQIPWFTVPGEGCWQDVVLDNDCRIVDLVKYQDHIVECVNSHDYLTAEVERLKAANAKLKAANAKMKKERDELYRDNVRLRSMANGTQDDAAFGRLLTLADWWDANYPFSPNEGKLLRKSWAKIVQLQAVNDKMREALLIIAGGKDARGNYEEVAWHMAQLAAEALAAEGEIKMSDCFSCIHFGKCSYDSTYCHSWDTKVAEGGAK